MHFQSFYSRSIKILLILVVTCGFAAAFNLHRVRHNDDSKIAFSKAYLALAADGCSAPTPSPSPQPTPTLEPRVDEVVTALAPSLLVGAPGDTLRLKGSLTNTTSASFVMIGYGFVNNSGVCIEGNAPACPILNMKSLLATDPLPAQTSTGEVDITDVQLNPAYAGPLPTIVKFTFYTTRQGAFTGFADFAVRIQPRTDAAAPPLLFTDPCTQHVVALDSVTLTSGPFALPNSTNFSSDQRTRLTLFAWNMNLQPGEGAGDVSVEAIDSQQTTITLPVEFVSDVAGQPGLTQITVKLPDSLSQGGDLRLRILAHGFTSNEAPLTIQSSVL